MREDDRKEQDLELGPVPAGGASPVEGIPRARYDAMVAELRAWDLLPLSAKLRAIRAGMHQLRQSDRWRAKFDAR
jgi:hypothetical protein